MPARPAVALAVAVLLLAATARASSAQEVTPFLPLSPPSVQPRPEVTPPPPPPADPQAQTTGVSLARIRRLLREQPAVQVGSVARLQFHIEVVGRMPPIDIGIRTFNIDKKSAVPYGGMTHAEFMRVVAPPWRKW